MELIIEWDSAKAKSNLRKHGISFVEAAQVFKDPLFWIERTQIRRSDG